MGRKEDKKLQFPLYFQFCRVVKNRHKKFLLKFIRSLFYLDVHNIYDVCLKIILTSTPFNPRRPLKVKNLQQRDSRAHKSFLSYSVILSQPGWISHYWKKVRSLTKDLFWRKKHNQREKIVLHWDLKTLRSKTGLWSQAVVSVAALIEDWIYAERFVAAIR